MNEQTTIAKGAFWALVSQFAVKLLAFIYLVIIAHFLPADTIGLFYLALSILGILYVFTDLGIIYALNRYVPYFHAKGQFENLRRLVAFSYGIGGGITLLFSTLIYFFAGTLAGFFSQPLLEPAFRGLAFWLFLQEMFDISRGIINGMKRVKESQLLEVIVNAVRFVLTLLAFAWIGFALDSLVVPYILAFIGGMVLALHYARKEVQVWNSAVGENVLPYPQLGKEVIGFGFTVMVISMFWLLMQYIDRVMLNYLQPNALAGIGVYSIATGFASLILLFAGAISVIFFPVISELYGKEKRQEMQQVTATSIHWLVLVSLPLLALFLVFAQELLQLFYGAEYAAGRTVLILFSLGLFIRSVSMLPGLVIATLRRLDVELFTAGIATLLNVLLNLWFIPLWGIDGAALASALSLVAVTLMLFYYGYRLFGFSLPPTILRLVLAGGLTTLLLFVAKPSVVQLLEDLPAFPVAGGLDIMGQILGKLLRLLILGFLFLFASLIYFGLLLVLKALGREDIGLLQAALRRARVPESYVTTMGNLLSLRIHV